MTRRGGSNGSSATEMPDLLYEERLSRRERRRVMELCSYGRKIEQVMEALLKL
jgi:hypothetical protein